MNAEEALHLLDTHAGAEKFQPGTRNPVQQQVFSDYIGKGPGGPSQTPGSGGGEFASHASNFSEVVGNPVLSSKDRRIVGA